MQEPIPRDEDPLLAYCQQALGYAFHDVSYLRSALTHASSANHRLASNERLEFLGDAILGAVVCELLYRKFPEYLEGDLTRVKSVVVSRIICAKISKDLGFQEFLILGKGMGSQSQAPSSILADLFESLVGAIYLDGGMDAAKEFVIRHIQPEIDETVANQGGSNHKSLLQQLAQREFGATPTYLLLDEKGPDHSKCFKIAAQIADRGFAPAWGRNKKDAEQRAALNAISQISGAPIPFEAD